MRIKVLGSAAGGGFPQWNCGCANCRAAREGKLQARTQECVAISADDRRWYLLNVSPEIRAQIESFSPLHPRAPRDTPIAGIVLTNGDLDHCLGLFSLRESQPLMLYATEPVYSGLKKNVIFRTLQRFPEQLTYKPLHPNQTIRLDENLSLTAFAAPGKRPLHEDQTFPPRSEDNVGLILKAKNKSLAYFPAAAAITPEMAKVFAEADALFFDGTFWRSDELLSNGLSNRKAEDMAHKPVSESLGNLQNFRARKILIHLNNTNPLLDPNSDAYLEVTGKGLEVATDGLEIVL